jgi:hypothetical protein
MCSTRKHTLDAAAKFSGLNKSQFSRFLKKNFDLSLYCIEDLSKKKAKQFAGVLECLKNGQVPWKVAILIDSTLQSRSTLHTANCQRFNHGSGFVIGHQWTNIVLIINGFIIPLPPIAYNSRNFCKKNNLEYKTENDCVVEYIEYLNIGEYIGEYNAEDIVVLADSGYDAKKIEEAICEKGWKFIIALKRTRSVRSKAQHARDPKSKNWFSVAELFRNYRRAKWQTVQLIVDGGKKKRMDFRIRQIIGNLKGVCHVQLICSEFKKRPDGRRKYLACNDLKVTAKQILIGYRLRWKIEIFHKEVKMFLGFQEVAAKNFNSVRSHVHWVYCAYILLHMIPELKDKPYLTLADRQKFVEEVYMKRNISGTLQLLSQFGGVAKYISQLRTALAETSIA